MSHKPDHISLGNTGAVSGITPGSLVDLENQAKARKPQMEYAVWCLHTQEGIYLTPEEIRETRPRRGWIEVVRVNPQDLQGSPTRAAYLQPLDPRDERVLLTLYDPEVWQKDRHAAIWRGYAFVTLPGQKRKSMIRQGWRIKELGLT